MVCPGDVYWQAVKAFELHDPCKAIHDAVKLATDVSSEMSIHTASLVCCCGISWCQGSHEWMQCWKRLMRQAVSQELLLCLTCSCKAPSIDQQAQQSYPPTPLECIGSR